MSSASFKLLISPIASEFHPGLILYNVAPAWDADAEILYKDGNELVLKIDFACLPDVSGRVYNIGKLIDLVI